MKTLLIAVLFLTGCATLHNPAKTDQLILNVPPELMKPPSQLEQL